MDLYMGDIRSRERCLRQQPGGGCSDPLAQERRVRPVADLKPAGADAVMQPAATCDPSFDKDAHHNVAPSQPVTLPLFDQRVAFRNRQGLLSDPRHPRPQVLDAFPARFAQDLNVLLDPPTQYERAGSSDQFGKALNHAKDRKRSNDGPEFAQRSYRAMRRRPLLNTE